MKVSIIGPGAMGCLYAARLAQAGLDTSLVDYQSERAARLNSHGITIESQDGTITQKVKVVSSVPNGQDLVIICVKSYSTGALGLNGRSAVLTLQNGLGNIETLCSMVGSANLLVGVTTEASTYLGEGHIRHAASGVTRLGSWTSCSREIASEVLGKAGFTVELTESPGQAVWEKVAVNAGINPITALLDIPNGRILDIPEARQLMRDLVVEAVKVACTEGYRFDKSMVEVAESTCEETKDNISSMLQDVRAHRRTEIDAISGEIMRRAQISALPTPRTRVVWQLLKGMERR
jgi:2-dehydropantoate 2-reductase